MVRAGDCDTCCGLALVVLAASCQHVFSCVSARLTCVGTGYTLHSGFLSYCVWDYEKGSSVLMESFFSLTKTIAANQQRREDDTSCILFTAVNSDDSLERKKKLCRGGDLHGDEEREREREEGWSWFSIFSLFIYALLRGFLSPTPAEDSPRLREMYRTGGSASAITST